MKVNKSIIMLILVIFILSLTSVCAGEMDDAIASNDTDQIELSSNDKISEDNLQTNEEKATLGESDDSTDVSLKSSDGDELSSSGEFGELQKLIDDASDKSTINLERNYTYTIGTDTITEGIIITKNLTINGNGFTIDAQGKSRILNIESGINVVLNNITFINGYTEVNGGAIFAYGNVDITGSRFINNTAVDGGAIATVGGIIMDVSFKDNHAEDEGGAVYFKGSGVVENCIFTNNTADYGGAVYIFGTGEVRDCVFINNTGFEFAGALMMIYGTVSDSSFTGNTAHIGGAVRINGEATVTRCNFTDNTATLEGGAVYLGSPGNVAFSNFIGNKATGDGVGGGAVLLYEGGNVSYSNFTNNHVSTDGGAVHFYDNGTLSDCNFYDNEAGANGGAVYFYFDGNVTDCNFTLNTAEVGGAIHFDIEGDLKNSIFIENKAINNGGAVWIDSGTVEDCTFISNTADKYGGAVYFNDTGAVTNCNFTDNTATYYGGAIYFYNNGAVKKSYFKDNSANNYSDIYCNSELILEDNTFVNNETNTSDAINIANAKLTLSKTAFTYNAKVQKPTVTLTNGAVLKEGVDYTLQWSTASPKNAGTYTVTVTGIGAYTGTAKATFVINKAANPLSVKAKTVKVKFSKLKKKAQTLAVSKVVKFTKKGQGTLTYAKSSGNKKITVNKKTGKVTIKKGLKKGTYKVKVKIKAKGNANYKASAFKTVTFKIKVK